MKKMITTMSISILLLSACNSTTSPDKGKQISNGLTYQDKDYGEKMNWNSAKKYCQSRGDKWRLPSFNELQKLTHSKKLKNAPKSDDVFWTANVDESMPEGDYHLTISSTGQLGTNEAFVPHSVLCVQ